MTKPKSSTEQPALNQSTRATRKLQQSRVRQYAHDTDSHAFFNMLTGPDFLDCVERHLPEHRERLYPPTETLSMFLAQGLSADRSCQNAVNAFAIKRSLCSLRLCSTNTSAYCQARQRLPLSMLNTLVRESGRLMSDRVHQPWLWKGRRVRLVDGTTIILPDTSSNQGVFGQPSSQKPGLGMPQCRMVSLVCFSTGAVLDTAIGPCEGKGSGETSLLNLMMDTLQPGDLLLGDAYYASYFLLCELKARGLDGVFEQFGARRSKIDFRRGSRLGARDHLITLSKPQRPKRMSKADYAQFPDNLTVRELSTGGKVLVTTLLCAKKATKAELKQLYRGRWHVELDLRNIKATLGMDMLSCKSAEMVEKELWVYLLAYNLIRLLMAQAAVIANIKPRELSFKHTVQLWIVWCAKTQYIDEGNGAYEILFALIAQRRVGRRPGRVEPRARKRRPSPYPVLSQPRQVAKEYIMKHGHPKKAKV